MKTHHKLTIIALLTILFLSSCQKDVFNPNAIKDDYFIKDIPNGFDWSSLSSVSVNVIPNDIYAGNYFYTIEIFAQNPIFNKQAVLFAKGVCTQEQPFQTKITIPDNSGSLFVRQTAPTGKKSIRIVDVVNKKLDCDFTPGNTSTSQSSPLATGTLMTQKTIDWQIPNNTMEISGTGTFTMKKNTSYVIQNTYTGTIVFPPEGKGVLYVAGTWNNTANTTLLTSNSEIYILNGGKILSENDWSITTNNMVIAIAQNGQFGSKNNDNIDLDINNPSELINEGIFYANNIITHTSNTNIYNNGEFNIAKLETRNPSTIENNKLFNAKKLELKNPKLKNNANAILTVDTLTTMSGSVLNKHKLTAQSITFDQTKVENECSIQTTELFIAKGSYEQASYTSLFSDNMHITGGRIDLNSSSLFVARNKVTFTSQKSQISGDGKDFAVFKAGEILWAASGPHIQFSGNLEINCSKFKDNPPYNPYYTLSGVAYFAENGSSIKIPGSDCTGNGNLPEEEKPENPVFPFPEHLTQPYTWIIEDVYPSLGDYDMNDFVISIDSIVRMMSEKNIAENMTLYMRIRAVGGTKRIGAALQFDELKPKTIQSVIYSDNVKFSDNIFETASNGAENGQTFAVVPLLENAHAMLGISGTKTIVNTISQGNPNSTQKDEQSFKITIKFSEPIPGDILTIDKFNFFAVVENQTGFRNTEIHLPEFKHTDKSKTPSELQQSTKGLMWGLLIPNNFRYAEEQTDIRKAYPKFLEWVTSNKQTNKDWYNHPDENNIYKHR